MSDAMHERSIAQRANAAPSRHLCVCADDFGLSTGINEAVLDLAERGSLSSTGCMVMRPAWAAGSRELRALSASRLEIGLHFDLTSPSRGRHGEAALGPWILKGYLGLLRPESMRARIMEQLGRFEDGLDRPPSFVDGHRHVHQLPGVADVLADVIANRYGTLTPWIRSTAPARMRRIPRSKEDLIFAMGGAGMMAAAGRRGIPTSCRLLGVYDFTGVTGSRSDYRTLLRGWLDICRTGDVLMCHPALDKTPSDPIAAARLREYVVLRDTVFPVETPTGLVSLAPLSHSGCGVVT
jgi:predicted glycoside hydrolase/deacetylase ChbG (UPF0249 family)